MESSIWILLSVLPPDKIKSLLKVAKKGEKGKIIFRISIESMKALRKVQKSEKVTKIIDSVHELNKWKDRENFTDKGVKHILDGEINKKRCCYRISFRIFER